MLQNLIDQMDDTKAIIWDACTEGKLETLIHLCRQYGRHIDFQDDQYGSTALMNASYRGFKNYVSELISYGARIDLQDKELWTSLMMAAWHGFHDVVQLLLNGNANVEIRNLDDWVALMMASYRGYTQIVEMLLDAKADVNAKNKKGATALMLAASQGREEVVKILLKRGANVHLKDHFGEPGTLPRRVTYESEHPYARNLREYTPIEIPGADSYEIAFDPMSSTENPSKGGQGDYIVFYSGRSYRDAKDEIRYIGKEEDNSQNFPGVNGIPPLEIRDKKFVMLFCTDHSGSDWGYKFTVTPKFNTDVNKSGWTALIWAAFKGHGDAVKILIDAGVAIDTQAWDGKTALAWALERHHEDAAIRLFRSGAQLDLPDKEDITPITKAVDNNLKKFISAVFQNFEPFVDPFTTEFKKGYDYVWTYLLSTTDEFRDDVYHVLVRFHSRIKSLADIEDKNGRTAFGIARHPYRQAFMERLLFHKRYEFLDGEPVHMSQTCVVRFAKDHNNNKSLVALKFIKRKQDFLKEVEIRQKCRFNDRYVIQILDSHDGDEDGYFLNESRQRMSQIAPVGDDIFPYCVVMPAADRNLSDILTHEGLLAPHLRNQLETSVKLKEICRDIVLAVQHIHSKGYIHGDIKPMNIMRLDKSYRLIDLDAGVCLNETVPERQFIGYKWSSAYIPPEMVLLTDNSSNQGMEADQQLKLAEIRTSGLLASKSYDIWSLGVTMFQILTGETLFHATIDDNLASGELEILSQFTESFKRYRLSVINNDYAAKNLLTKMLEKDPMKRPSINQILHHTYFTGDVADLFDEKPEFDVFLSYRKRSDRVYVSYLYESLTKLNLKVWWDEKCLVSAENWESGFCDGLFNSRVFVCIISQTVLSDFSQLDAASKCDNVLLEWSLAYELFQQGVIQSILPVVRGEPVLEDIHNGHQFDILYRLDWSRMRPVELDICINEVERSYLHHLHDYNLDRDSYRKSKTIHNITKDILTIQATDLSGNIHQSMKDVTRRIKQLCEDPAYKRRESLRNKSKAQRINVLRRHSITSSILPKVNQSPSLIRGMSESVNGSEKTMLRAYKKLLNT